MNSLQHKARQVLSNRKQSLKRISLPLVKLPDMWFMVMPNISRVLLEKEIVITNQINMSFPHSLFFILVGNDLIPLKTSYILPWRPQVTWVLLGCTICLILSPFLIHLDIPICSPVLGSSCMARLLTFLLSAPCLS